MSWQAAVFAVLGLVLVGGFAWYERSRPPSRVLALVAALAALAVAGRLVFAPIPNVVATTDVVLLTGYAVGAAPGFAVGALAALVSNFWLGQGPWTPWQMAGWGLVGLGGAALGEVTRRRLGRVGLAIACGVAGLAYGALLDLSTMVSYGGEQSLDRYLWYSARGLPFNIAHAAGNVALAWVAGPALARMLLRFRARLEVHWRPAPAQLATLAAVLLAIGLAALPAQARADAGAARSWLARAQNADGGFGTSPGSPSSASMTGWAVLGLEAAGRNPLDVRDAGHSAIGYLRARLAEVRSTGDLERTILALEGAGVDARSFGGRDLVSELRARRSGGASFQGQVNLTAFGVLALRAAGAAHAELSPSAAWLRQAQDDDGGWGFQPGAPSDADSTGAALQGLAAAAGGGGAAAQGVSYLRREQLADGGFALAGGGSSNSQSTAWAAQGLVAAGADPASVRSGGHSPLDYLAARQVGDGHYRYSAASDQTPVWVTGQALMAVERRALPIAAVARAPRPARSPAGSSGKGDRPRGNGGPGGGAGKDHAGHGRKAHRSHTHADGRSRDGSSHRAGRDSVSARTAAQPLDAPGPAAHGSSRTALYLALGGLAAGAAAAGVMRRRRRMR